MNLLPRQWRSTIRTRLTLLYAGAFFLAGVLLVGMMFLFMGQALDRQLTTRLLLADEQLQQSAEDGPARVTIPAVQEALQEQFRQDRDNTLRTMLIASLSSLVVVGAVAAGIGWLLAGQALQPLRHITATARRIADRSLHERIALDGPDDEIKDLADTLDARLERLDRSFDGQRRFVANAFHELRTPLAINRTLLEVALDNPGTDETVRQLGSTLLAVNQRHERLIDALLTLASCEQRIAEPIPVDLAEVARHVTNEARTAAAQANVEVRTDLQAETAAGDPVLLERLVHNLIENAIRYNLSTDGWLKVSAGAVDDDVHLTVENTGPPVPAYELPSLFEPFRRSPSTERLAGPANSSISRGSGLGLSIVRSVVRAHGGDAYASPGSEGGLTVRVSLPKASDGAMETKTGTG